MKAMIGVLKMRGSARQRARRYWTCSPASSQVLDLLAGELAGVERRRPSLVPGPGRARMNSIFSW